VRILVSGASGHVGGALATHLVEKGHDVLGLSRRPQATPTRADVVADISDRQAVETISRSTPCEAIVHAAASLDKQLHTPSVSLVNCLGTQNMLWLSSRWGCNRFIFISGVTVIGRPSDLPVTEEHSVRPESAYLASKLYGEHLTELTRLAGTAAVTLRLTSPVGPRMPDGRIFSVFARRAAAGEPLMVAGHGTRAQDFVDVRDVADGVEACLERRATGIFNLAAGLATSNLELAQACVDVLDSSSKIQFSGTPDADEGVRWEVSVERARKAFGFEPRRSLAESIEAAAVA